MLDRQGGQVDVGDQVARGAGLVQEAPEDCRVPRRRVHRRRGARGQPVVEDVQRLSRVERLGESVRRVAILTKASSATQAKPTGSSPVRATSIHRRARAWSGMLSLTA